MGREIVTTKVAGQGSNVRATKAERDILRRRQIVEAAKSCVVRYGFHAASMAQIAQQAQMSVGQIYRYFDSKESIIHAIVENIVEKRLSFLASELHTEMDFPKTLSLRFLNKPSEDVDDDNLLLEVTAEAARNPIVAQIVQKADQQLYAQAVSRVRKHYPGLSEQQAMARVEFMAVLTEGTVFRRATLLQAEPTILESLYRDVFSQLFPEKKRSE